MISKETMELLRLYAKIVGGIFLGFGILLVCGAIGHELGIETGRGDEGTAAGIGAGFVIVGLGLIEAIHESK